MKWKAQRCACMRCVCVIKTRPDRLTRTEFDVDDGYSFSFLCSLAIFSYEILMHSPSFCFLSAPFPKLLFVMGRFQPRQLLHKLSGSELQLHNESSSNRSESSKVNRSHSSFHSGTATASGSCCGGCACGGEARTVPGCCCPGGSPTASPTLASSFIYFNRHVTNFRFDFHFFFGFLSISLHFARAHSLVRCFAALRFPFFSFSLFLFLHFCLPIPKLFLIAVHVMNHSAINSYAFAFWIVYFLIEATK